MIEQTELVIDEWNYTPPENPDPSQKLSSDISLEVMRKTAPTKKGLACRFTCRFFLGETKVLVYVAQDSYVIDLDDKIDAAEIQRMIKNSYSKLSEKYDLRKMGTILRNTPLTPFDEKAMDIGQILSFLN